MIPHACFTPFASNKGIYFTLFFKKKKKVIIFKEGGKCLFFVFIIGNFLQYFIDNWQTLMKTKTKQNKTKKKKKKKISRLVNGQIVHRWEPFYQVRCRVWLVNFSRTAPSSRFYQIITAKLNTELGQMAMYHLTTVSEYENYVMCATCWPMKQNKQTKSQLRNDGMKIGFAL